MSFLELSLYVYEQPVKSANRVADFLGFLPLSAVRRKAIFKSGLLLLIASAFGYVAVSGTIVTDNLKRAALAKELSSETRALENARSGLTEGASALTIDYLNSLGYAETKNLNVIKRTNNVAGKSTNVYQ